MLQVVGNILSFLAVYTCLDSVAVDLDSADAVPESLKWTLNEEKELLREYEDLQEGNGRWKLYESHPNEGFDVYWLHSDAYDREMIKLTGRIERPRKSVFEAIWLGLFVSSTWHSLFSSAAVVNYAGRNRAVLYQQSNPSLPSRFVAPRDYVMYTFYRDDARAGTTWILASNVSSTSTSSSSRRLYRDQLQQLDQPIRPGVVRGISGTAGITLTSLSNSSTSLAWLMNAENYPPAFAPRRIVRKVAVSSAVKAYRDLRAHLTHPYSSHHPGL